MDKKYLKFPDKYFSLFDKVDMVIDLMAESIAPDQNFPSDKIKYFAYNMKALFDKFTKKKAFIQVRIPSEELAESAAIDSAVFENVILKALDIDYKELNRKAEKMINFLKTKNKVEIITGKNNKMTFKINNKWYKDVGKGDLPCGEIYTAPKTKSAHGSIVIDKLNVNGKFLVNVELKFEEGKLVGCTESEVFNYLANQKGDKDLVGEFGLGLNNNINEYIGYSLTDEKISGTMHIAIGANKMFGGDNKASHHWDFIFKPEKVYIDGKKIFEKGKYLSPMSFA